MIVDAQIHLWPPVAPVVGHVSLEADDILRMMDGAGVDMAVLVPPPSSMGPDTNAPALRAVRQHPDRLLCVAVTSLESGTVAELGGTLEDGEPSAIRVVAASPSDVRWVSEGGADWIWEVAAQVRLPINLYAPRSTDLVAKLASRFPTVPICLDHLNLAKTGPGETIGEQVDDVLGLAPFANVAVKASGLPAHDFDGYPFTSLHHEFARVVEGFGAARVFWGSDFTRLRCSYSESIDWLREAPAGLMDSPAVLGDSLLDWYGRSRPLIS